MLANCTVAATDTSYDSNVWIKDGHIYCTGVVITMLHQEGRERERERERERGVWVKVSCKYTRSLFNHALI